MGQCLDRYVISDEEIIEDATFGGKRFGARASAFKLSVANFVKTRAKQNTYECEAAITRDLLARVNRILARNSPVLIIQRFFRGYAMRKRYLKSRLEARTYNSLYDSTFFFLILFFFIESLF